MRSKEVRSQVERFLITNQLYRDSDKHLLISFWEKEGLQLTDFQKTMFMQCTPAGSITRARRFLRGKYPASSAVEEARYERFKEERDDHSNFFNKRFGRIFK